jgi:FkbM family methyltransferase
MNGELMQLEPAGVRKIELGGVLLELDVELISQHVLAAIEEGKYERSEARQLCRVLEQGERIVELGGGIGYLSTLALKQGKVESAAVYEANPRLIPVIIRTHALNGVSASVFNAVVLPKAEVETMPFYVRKHFWASSLSPRPWGYTSAVNVATVSFAAMLEQHRPTMLIIDIEGGESQLLRGVPLTGVSKVLIEIHQRVIGAKGVKRVFDFFSKHRFHYDQNFSAGSVILFRRIRS